MEVHGGMVMRCLIPITQEMRNENAMRRAQIICDDIHILYVLDRGLLDRMKRESAYVLDSETLREIEETVIKSQKEEATGLLRYFGKSGKNVQIHFEVGDYISILEKYVLKMRPRLLMVDAFSRALLSLHVPIWVDAGNEIRSCVFVVESAVHIKKTERNIYFIRDMCKRMGCNFFVTTEKHDKETEKILSSYAPITDSKKADLIVLEKYQKKMGSLSRNSIIVL